MSVLNQIKLFFNSLFERFRKEGALLKEADRLVP